jgi:formylglycine-generating enzyme required for sulfatase activity
MSRKDDLEKNMHEFEPEMILIPAGKFLMGTREEDIPRLVKQYGGQREWYVGEVPQHTLYLPDYYIAKTPVTNAQYQTFVLATGQELPRHWEGGKPSRGREDHPVVYVSWHDAIMYCQWLARVIGRPYRLPSEAEWEKAARGTDGRILPWGNKWDASRCNTRESGTGDTTAVGTYPQGASPYGCLDMAGNVWEWTSSLYQDYPYDPKDGRENLTAGSGRVVRGGSFGRSGDHARCTCRGIDPPDDAWNRVGFRLCVSSISP